MTTSILAIVEASHVDVWSDGDVNLVLVDWDRVARAMFDGDDEYLQDLLTRVKALPDSAERSVILPTLEVAVLTALTQQERGISQNIPDHQLGILRS
jgi:hypothetical protein